MLFWCLAVAELGLWYEELQVNNFSPSHVLWGSSSGDFNSVKYYIVLGHTLNQTWLSFWHSEQLSLLSPYHLCIKTFGYQECAGMVCGLYYR